MAVDLEKVKAWLADLSGEVEADGNALVGSCGLYHIEALVAEVEGLRAEIAQMREDDYHAGIERDLAD